MLTLEDIYRDVNSRIVSMDIDEKSIFDQDVINSINDAIRGLRVAYVRDGIGRELAETENFDAINEDSDYPFMNSATLSKEVLDDLPIELVVLSSTGYVTNKKIENTTQIFNKGDLARKGVDLYECVETFSGVNAFDRTFDQRVYRTFHKNNGRKYKKGDVVYVKTLDKYYKVNATFTNNTDDDPDNISELDKLYWKKVGDSDIYLSHYPFKNIQILRTFEDFGRIGALTIRDKKLYVTPNVTEVTLTYVPKWTDVTTFTDNVDIPDVMLPAVKDRAIASLAKKLNLEYQVTERLVQDEEEDG